MRCNSRMTDVSPVAANTVELVAVGKYCSITGEERRAARDRRVAVFTFRRSRTARVGIWPMSHDPIDSAPELARVDLERAVSRLSISQRNVEFHVRDTARARNVPFGADQCDHRHRATVCAATEPVGRVINTEAMNNFTIRAFNPQPEPPARLSHVGFNPQPEPPARLGFSSRGPSPIGLLLPAVQA